MIVWGGFNGSGTQSSGGVHDPVANTWSLTNTTGAPTARYDHTAVWTGFRMVVWGGNGGLANGSAYDPLANTWSGVSAVGATGREQHRAVWTGPKMLVWGGYNGGYLNTGGAYAIDGDLIFEDGFEG